MGLHLREIARRIPGLKAATEVFRDFKVNRDLPAAAKEAHDRDRKGLPVEDPGADAAIDLGARWLALAQDRSVSNDGGVAWCYSLLDGWGTSYPETTGYIIPTVLAYASLRSDDSMRDRAARMLDWLAGIQFPEGGYRAGFVDGKSGVPVTFNTGQILLGLAAGVREFVGKYQPSMRLAADWLVRTQDSDGCWRSFPTPLAVQSDKTYETHVAWGLLEAARLEQDKSYAESALRNVRWAVGMQKSNGWFPNCCLTDPTRPLTHTLGYALRGVLEAYRFSQEQAFLDAAVKTGDGLLSAIRKDGFIAGRLDKNWKPAVSWACLTGNAQVALGWLILYRITGNVGYRDAAFAANSFVRRTMMTSGNPDLTGAIKGSFPIGGKYFPYRYINWACKFFVDSNMLERQVRLEESGNP